MTPIAIVVAGLFVAGAVMYTNMQKAPVAAPKTAGDPGYKYQKYLTIATSLKLDESKFKACMDEYNADEIKKDASDGSAVGVSGTPAFFIGIPNGDKTISAVTLVGAQPFETFKLILDKLVETKNVEQTIKALPEQLRTDDAGKALVPVTVSLDDDAMLGNPAAPITILEFSDYECPFCKRHFEQTQPRLLSEYINSGKANLVFRDYPLPFHEPMATEEAIAANCARQVGGDQAYYEYHDQIFTKTRSNKEGIPE